MTIGNRISELRKKKGFTQEYIAEQLGVSRQAVSKWEQDQTSPDTRNLIALSKLLSTSVEYIATGYADHHNDAEQEKDIRLLKSSRFTSDLFIVLGIIVILIFANYAFGWIVGICLIAFGISLMKQAEKLEKEIQQADTQETLK